MAKMADATPAFGIVVAVMGVVNVMGSVGEPPAVLAMFDTASAELKPYSKVILREIGKALNAVPNKVSFSGHTDAAQFGGGEKGFSNWELSANRANASRREMIAGGMDENKVLRVVGLSRSAQFVQPAHQYRRAQQAYRGSHAAGKLKRNRRRRREHASRSFDAVRDERQELRHRDAG